MLIMEFSVSNIPIKQTELSSEMENDIIIMITVLKIFLVSRLQNETNKISVWLFDDTSLI